MAASSGDDVPTQLAALLGREIFRIRKTDETPPRVSIIDVVMAVTGGSQHDAARSLRRLSDQYPEVGPNWSHLKFKGKGQRDTCVTDAKGIVEVIMLLPGQQAARVRRQAAELLCRYLGGRPGSSGRALQESWLPGAAGCSSTRGSAPSRWRSGRGHCWWLAADPDFSSHERADDEPGEDPRYHPRTF